MNYGIDGYVYGTVTNIEDIGNNQCDYTIFLEETKNTIIATLDIWDVDIGNEIELLHKEKIKGDDTKEQTICIARHNISKNIKEKGWDDIEFPLDIFKKNHLNDVDKRQQKLHILYTNALWMYKLCKKYHYLRLLCGMMWGARDPNIKETFSTSKQYFDNARHICFFYNITKAREKIRDVFRENLLDEGVFISIVKSFYMEFLIDVKDIPDTYHSYEGFWKYFIDIKDEVGL